jgi:hypothetical protein
VNWKAPVPQRLSVVVRPASAALCILLAAAMAITPASPAAAADPYPGPDGTTNQTLEQQLDAAAHAYVDAKGRLDASRTRQADLQQRLDVTQQRLTDLESQIGPIAAAAYRGNRVNMSALLLGSGSATALLHDAATVEYIARRDDREIRELSLARKAYADQKAAVDAEIVVGEQQTAEMEKRKNDAAKALGNPGPGTAVGTTLRASASPSPRNSDGSWPAESCSADDPTTSGCLTARTLHALNQARAAGFTHFTACFRSGGSGEHPKGRACDFAANATGFANVRASGADKAYGDQLAAWFIANSDRLAVLYVIWFKQIWLPGLGWRAYTSGDGTPAGDHFNHVHLSVN